jgi:hypothetical protein
MSVSPTRRAIVCLSEEDPSYQKLVDLYHLLSTSRGESPPENVAQYAVAQVIGELIDYLDLVADEFEKSIGLTRKEERQRILAAFDPPAGDDSLDQVDDIIRQWQAIERYSPEDIVTAVYQSQPSD